MERGSGDKAALAEISETYGMPCFAIVTIEDVMQALRGREVDGQIVLSEERWRQMTAYREEFGRRA
jgi:orotate phosphoribosyltransferase